MPESIKAIQSLKRASNFTKLAFREFGPKSYKKGQGALLKVVYKFGEDGAINKKTAEKILNWNGRQLRHVAKKAEKNGYIAISDPEFQFQMSLTDKGTEVIKKRLAAEDRTADTVLEALSADEIQTLIALTDKISKTCEGLGVDYSRIEKKRGKCRKGQRQGNKGCKDSREQCCHTHSHSHSGHKASQYVFVFGEGHHHC